MAVQLLQRLLQPSDFVTRGLGSGLESTDNAFIFFDHDAYPIDTVLELTVDGSLVASYVPRSGSSYEMKRISTTRCIIRSNVPGSHVYGVQPSGDTPVLEGIGQAVIGSTFKVA